MGQQSYTASATGNWTCPPGVFQVKIECWGAGGAGGGQASLTQDGGGGGGGGAYARINVLAVTPSQTYAYVVGAKGAGSTGNGTRGGTSSFTTICKADGGYPGLQSTGTPPVGGLGGSASLCVGDVKYSGGQGEKGEDSQTGAGAYGGSSGGTASDGFSGPQTWSTVTFPVGSLPAGAGVGGNGGARSASGVIPASGNGGGGGGSGCDGTNLVGAAGADGKVVITWEDNVVLNIIVNA